ncbi:MAG: serine/threonine protein phosphatase [Candidatus Omnitrophica bacterium]|nr:serine/threonine protein phosphatase [Candidatus Omnitrophota bacterium]
MTYIITDIHGEYDKLNSLLGHISDARKIIFLGDYSDKGAKVKEVIERLQGLSDEKKCIFLMGDHEHAWMQYLLGEERFLDFLINYGGIATLESYIGKKLDVQEARQILVDKKGVTAKLKDFLLFCSNLALYHKLGDDFLCVHAGIEPTNKDKPLKEHNKERMVFIRDEFINSQILYQGRRVIFGHTAKSRPYVDDYKIGIDTGAVYKDLELGVLTAYNVTKDEFISHNGNVEKCLSSRS